MQHSDEHDGDSTAADTLDDTRIERNRVQVLLRDVIFGSVIVALISCAATWLLDPTQTARFWAYLLSIPLSLSLLILLKRGYARWTWVILTTGLTVLMLGSNVLGQRPFAIGVAIGLLVIVMAGMYGSRLGVIVVTIANVALALISAVYWVSQTAKPVQPAWVLIDTVSYIILSILGGVGMSRSVNLLTRTLQQAQSARKSLAQQNRALEQRIAERTQQLAASELYYRSLIQNTSDLVMILGLDGRIHFQSPSAFRVLGYDPQIVDDRSALGFVHPDDAPRIAQALLSETFLPDLHERRYEMRLHHADGSWHNMEATAALVPSADANDTSNIRVLVNLRDITERKRVEAALQHRIDFEKVIADISRNFVRLGQDQFDEGIDYALETVGRFTDVDVCRISQMLTDGETLEMTHEWLREGMTLQRKGLRQALNIHNGWWLDQFLSKQHVQISVLDELPPEIEEVRTALRARGLQSMLLVPLFRGKHIIGLLGLDNFRAPKLWTEENLTLLQILAEIMANALERKRADDALTSERDSLEIRVTNRTHEISKLLEVSQTVGSTLEIEPLLSLILDKLKEVVDYDVANVSELRENAFAYVIAFRGPVPPDKVVRHWNILPEDGSYAVDLIQHRKSVSIENIFADTLQAQSWRENFRREINPVIPSFVQSVLLAPLIVRNHVIGILALHSAQVGYYNETRTVLVTAFANQIAISMETARLHNQAVQAAGLNERSRLARDLHDSVSQALFGIVLGAKTLTQISDPNNPRMRDATDFVLQLSEAALAEMRALIFELHPESLRTEGLIVAFQKQAAALCARHKIDVQLNADTPEPSITIEAKEALYRIGLEAIQNTIKHAGAKQVALNLQTIDDYVQLEVKDNGQGFDTTKKFAGHFGLRSMRERAEQFGATIEIGSAAGQGTVVQVRMPLSS